MAWDNTQPTDNTKLRLAPALIRANWDALETGGVPFDYLQLQEQATEYPGVHPANTGFLYAKQSGTTTEAFFENDAGTIKQLTGLQVASQAITGGTCYGITTPWGVKINWGSGQCAGGLATVTFAVAFADTNYGFTATRGINAQDTTNINYYNEQATSINVRSDGTINFKFVAIGI